MENEAQRDIISTAHFDEWKRTGPLPLEVLQTEFGLKHDFVTSTDFDFETFVNMKKIRTEVIKQFGFAIPSLEIITDLAARKLIELGAGTGYWAHLITNAGGDILASDASATSTYSFTTGSHFPVEICDAVRFVKKHPDRDVLIVWPTLGSAWAESAARAMEVGRTLYLIGEGYGGCTADDGLFEYLNDAFEVITYTGMPVWPGIHDRFTVYKKTNL